MKSSSSGCCTFRITAKLEQFLLSYVEQMLAWQTCNFPDLHSLLFKTCLVSSKLMIYWSRMFEYPDFRNLHCALLLLTPLASCPSYIPYFDGSTNGVFQCSCCVWFTTMQFFLAIMSVSVVHLSAEWHHISGVFCCARAHGVASLYLKDWIGP